jgi:hypothetical protein
MTFSVCRVSKQHPNCIIFPHPQLTFNFFPPPYTPQANTQLKKWGSVDPLASAEWPRILWGTINITGFCCRPSLKVPVSRPSLGTSMSRSRDLDVLVFGLDSLSLVSISKTVSTSSLKIIVYYITPLLLCKFDLSIFEGVLHGHTSSKLLSLYFEFWKCHNGNTEA